MRKIDKDRREKIQRDAPAGFFNRLLACACALMPDWVVADIGAGTGNLARLFLAAGHQVVGVEPNREMRK